jgi:thioredoxin reductase (NADPH)
MLVRGGSLEAGMSQYLVDQIQANKNIEVILRSEVIGVSNGERFESVDMVNQDTGQALKHSLQLLCLFSSAQHRIPIYSMGL